MKPYPKRICDNCLPTNTREQIQRALMQSLKNCDVCGNEELCYKTSDLVKLELEGFEREEKK